MVSYEYGRIQKLAEQLEAAGVEAERYQQIMEGGEAIRSGTTPEKKAEWMREAMRRMDLLIDVQTRHAIREACACCLGGKRQKVSKAIAQNHETLDERIQAANETPFVFGHSVTLQEDGKIKVLFAPEGEAEYHCVCLRGAKTPVSITYCYCCGGHVKHHLQNALGRELQVRVVTSALSSGGKRPCTFLLNVKE